MNNKKIPIFMGYVLGTYGTGAVVKLPIRSEIAICKKIRTSG